MVQYSTGINAIRELLLLHELLFQHVKNLFFWYCIRNLHNQRKGADTILCHIEWYQLMYWVWGFFRGWSQHILVLRNEFQSIGTSTIHTGIALFIWSTSTSIVLVCVPIPVDHFFLVYIYFVVLVETWVSLCVLLVLMFK